MTASIMGIERLRDNVDGPGIRTLVLFNTCPLQCKYCLNKMMLESGIRKEFTARELYGILSIDDPYFELTEGGATFGGGEPALQSRFIEEFHELAGGTWNIMLETSLNVQLRHIQRLAPIVKRFYVDVKDMDPGIYREYTGRDNSKVYSNLEWLVTNGYASKVTARVPRIPEFNTEEDVASSIRKLKESGISDIETFEYIQTRKHHSKDDIVLMGDLTPEGVEMIENARKRKM